MTTTLTESHKIGVRRASCNDGQKRDHLRNNAATVTASSCINGSGWGGLGLGGVGSDGEELNEEIHWCDCVVCGWTDAIELFDAERACLLSPFIPRKSERRTCTSLKA